MLKIHVYFNNGCELECTNVVNTRAFWRNVSKWCKRTNRELSPQFARYNPMRVTRIVKERDPE